MAVDLYPDLRLGGPDPDVTIKPQQELHPTDAATAIAAFRRENEIGSLLADEMQSVRPYEVEDGFDFKAAAIKAGHDQYLERYAEVFNQRAADALTAKINREEQDARTLGASGFGTFMSLVAGIASPTTFLPGGAIYRGVKTGRAVVRSALSVGAAAAGATALQEGALQASQESRTPTESAFAIGGGALLGALLGGTASRFLSVAERRTLADAIDRELSAPEAAGEFADPATPMRGWAEQQRAAAAAAGADVARADTIGDLTIAGRATAQVANNTARLNPGLRLFTNPLATARSAGEKLFEFALYLNKHFGPLGARTPESVEELVLQHQGKFAGAIDQSRQVWSDYRASGGTLTKDKFWEQVGVAMQEGDKHAVPQVATMASIFRRDVVAPLTKAAIDAGLLPKDIKVTTAASYFSRVWNRQKIIETEPQFRKVIRAWLKDTLEAHVTKATAARDTRVAAIERQIGDLTMPAEQRAALLSSLPEELKKLRADNGDFDALDEALADMRREAARRSAAGQRDVEQFTTNPDGTVTKTVKGGPREITANIKATVDAAGSEYADYVARRFAIQHRMGQLRRNIAGSEIEVERLRGKLVDAEATNIARLHKLHESLSKLDADVASADPGLVAGKLADARTAFARILERSNAAHDRLAKHLAKLREDATITERADVPQRAPVPEDLSDILHNARTPLPRDPRKTMRDHPVRDMLRALGGVDPDGPLAKELAHAGVTPATSRGLFKKGGIQSGDNLVASEHELFRDSPDTAESDLAGKGYIKPDAIVEALKAEAGGAPLRTAHELQQIEDFARHADARDYYRDILRDMGIDVEKMSDDAILERLGDVAFQRKVMAEMDAAPPAKSEAEGGAAPEVVTKRDAEIAARRERVLSLFTAAERQRVEDLGKVAQRIGELENSDPQAALDLLRATIDRRVADSYGIIEREALHMDRLSRQMDAADPKRKEALVKELQAKAAKVRAEFDDHMNGIDAGNGYASYLDDIENNIVNKLTGRDINPADVPHNLVVATRGPLKERRLGIEDAKVRPWLDMNAERVMGRFVRIMGAEVELARRFNDTPDLKGTIAKIEAEGAEKRAEIAARLSPQGKADAHAAVDARAKALVDQAMADKSLASANGDSEPTLRRQAALDSIEANRQAEHGVIDKAKPISDEERAQALVDLDKKKNGAIEDLSALRDILRGTYKVEENNSMLGRVLNVANVVNYVTRLGGVVLSSFNDAVRPMMLHGLSRYMSDGIAPLISNLKAVQASRKDGLLGGALAERITMGYVASWAEVLDPYARKSTFERFMDNTARVYSKYGNFILPWTDWVKTIDYMIAQKRVIQNVRNWSKLDDNERAFMRLNHIDDAQASKIVEQLDKHASEIDGIEVANSHRWDDEAARRAFDAAMIKDTRTGVVTPGIADKPLAMHDPIGRALLQFQSYTFAAHSKILLRSMQGVERGVDAGRAGVMLGMMTAVSMGMFTYYLKTIEAGRPLSDNPGKWLAEGLDRSGLLTVFFLANNSMEKLSGYGGYGALASLFPGKDQGLPASRYRDRSATGTIAGPTGDLVDSVVNLLIHTSNGKLGEADVRAVKRLAPFANVPEINSILNHFAVPAAIEATN